MYVYASEILFLFLLYFMNFIWWDNYKDVILCNSGISQEEVKGIVDLAVAKSLLSLSVTKIKKQNTFRVSFFPEFYLFY